MFHRVERCIVVGVSMIRCLRMGEKIEDIARDIKRDETGNDRQDEQLK